jgi:hypothetical protein
MVSECKFIPAKTATPNTTSVTLMKTFFDGQLRLASATQSGMKMQ